jgi:hypothetical protein
VIGAQSLVSAASRVSPDDYAATVCGYAASYATQAMERSATVQQASQTFQAQPTQVNAVALRQALIDLLDQIGNAADQFAASAESAGTPDVPHGTRIAKAVVSHIRTQADTIRSLAALANQIDVSSVTQFVTDLQLVSQKVDKTERRLIKLAARDAAFKRPPPALQPLVVFLTTDATTCPGIS